MDFKKDFKIKPKLVEPNGSVLFTDGTNDVIIRFHVRLMGINMIQILELVKVMLDL